MSKEKKPRYSVAVRRSVVWKFFEEMPDRTSAQCLLCRFMFTLHDSRSTTNLRKHLKARHPIEALALNEQPGDSAPYEVKIRLPNSENLPEKNEHQTTANYEKLSLVTDSKAVLSTGSTGEKETMKTAVWKFFEKIDNNTQAKCRLCNAVLKAYVRSATNLINHLKAKHPSVAAGLDNLQYSSDSAPKVNTVNASIAAISRSSESSASHQRYSDVPPPPSMRKKVIDEKLIAMIAKDLQPVSIVANKGFLDLLRMVDPQYLVPNKTVVATELLPNLYKRTVDNVMKRFEGIDHFALTTDMWSEKSQEIYLSVMAHFISPTEWTPQSAMLSTIAFYGNPTGEAVSTEIQRIITEWNLSDKITVMITDSKTNTCLANEQLPWAYVPCLGNLMHIIVTDAISGDIEATSLIENVNSIVEFFHHSDNATESLIETQRAMGLELSDGDDGKLIINMPNRWNSIFHMLESIIERFDAVNAVLDLYGMEHKRLSTQDGVVMKKILSSLKPFEYAASTLSCDQNKNTSISMALPLIKGLMKMMESLTGTKEPLTQNLRKGLIESFGTVEDIEWIVTSSLLDPRFKKFPFAENDKIDKAKENIFSELSKSVEPKQVDSCTVLDSSTDKSGEDSFWQYLDAVTETETNNSNNTMWKQHAVSTAASREAKVYLESPPISREENPLFYWKQHQELYPNLYKIALKYLAVPITSIPTNRLFTSTGDMVTERRSNLKSKNMNMILFLNENL